jgi:hypothetical protein
MTGFEEGWKTRFNCESSGFQPDLRRGKVGELYGWRVPRTTPDVVVLASVVQTNVLGGVK